MFASETSCTNVKCGPGEDWWWDEKVQAVLEERELGLNSGFQINQLSTSWAIIKRRIEQSKLLLLQWRRPLTNWVARWRMTTIFKSCLMNEGSSRWRPEGCSWLHKMRWKRCVTVKKRERKKQKKVLNEAEEWGRICGCIEQGSINKVTESQVKRAVKVSKGEGCFRSCGCTYSSWWKDQSWGTEITEITCWCLCTGL